MEDKYVNFGDVCRKKLGIQCQYGSFYINGIAGFPNLGNGLRFKNIEADNYHQIEIHLDDVDEFVLRINSAKKCINGEWHWETNK